MTVLTFSVLLFIVATLAGTLGALTGLGGGVVLIPVLILVFHVNIHYVMGASLIAVIATSSGTSVAWLRQGYTNIRIGMFLETGAVIGALAGAMVVKWVPVGRIVVLFGVFLLFSSWLTFRSRSMHSSLPSADSGENIRLSDVPHVPMAFGIMTLAGILSGLLGIGSGVLKVLAMDQAMRLPYRVSTTTSNFMMGITAAVSAGVYFTNGYINPQLTFPVITGVLLGAFCGGKLLPIIHDKRLRELFSLAVLLLAVEMIYKGWSGNL